ncbi:hypothetical protein P170DRAFT_505846 [Aspergillus steynii IBT 23096]|uniref:Uncharacterized protein n=1 Tax=Aspergillus steynii IBT 23096 TaxID=1392250 RepID=A0A2I2GQR9_9EURO|nr:uncharacterized protein P170DRAFT_505846 [Aspergillus steynii IBT 23096]PLB55232.1 hypothetical protein P170DRAFT_505846 [Aspergillus steynii IBT 23096]
MGQNVSAVNGVRSDNYYQPGNAINEIWFGDVELISRLPFGDSDMAQAGWSNGEWPKVPWHNFIIPMKRDLVPTTVEHAVPVVTVPATSPTDQKDAPADQRVLPGKKVSPGKKLSSSSKISPACSDEGGDDDGWDEPGVLSDVGTMALMGVLSTVSVASFRLPIYLRQRPEPTSLSMEPHRTKTRYYISRAAIGTLSMMVSLTAAILSLFFLMTFRPSSSLRAWFAPLFITLCSFLLAWGLYIQVKTVIPLWKDWRKVWREGDLELVQP